MKAIHVESITDSHDCETCGLEFASGYVISVDGVVAIDKTPYAYCYNETDYPEDGYWFDILGLLQSHLGGKIPVEMLPENIIGVEPENPQLWNAWNDRRCQYPHTIQALMAQHGIALNVEHTEHPVSNWDDDEDVG